MDFSPLMQRRVDSTEVAGRLIDPLLMALRVPRQVLTSPWLADRRVQPFPMAPEHTDVCLPSRAQVTLFSAGGGPGWNRSARINTQGIAKVELQTADPAGRSSARHASRKGRHH